MTVLFWEAWRRRGKLGRLWGPWKQRGINVLELLIREGKTNIYAEPPRCQEVDRQALEHLFVGFFPRLTCDINNIDLGVTDEKLNPKGPVA